MAIETSSDGPPAFQWLGWSLPLFRLGRITYRLNWTLMVASVFAAVDVIESRRYDLLPFAILIPNLVVFLHSQAKVGMLRLIGGTADTSMLWSLGDSMPMRIAIRPAPQFLVAAAGIVVSGLIWLSLCYVYASHYGMPWHTTFGLGSRAKLFTLVPGVSIPSFCVGFASMSSCAVMLWNLVPSSVFDGGRLWRAMLWPVLGLRRATWVSIFGGFGVAILLLILGIVSTDFFALVFGLCVLLSSIYERRSMKQYGFDVVIGIEPAFATRERNTSPGLLGRFLQRREEKRLARQEAQEQLEQDVLDRLLAKVSEQGLPALTPAERQLLGRISKQQKARLEAQESRSSY